MQGNDEDLYEYGQPLTIDYAQVTALLYPALKQSITEIEQLKDLLQKQNKIIEDILKRI